MSDHVFSFPTSLIMFFSIMDRISMALLSAPPPPSSRDAYTLISPIYKPAHPINPNPINPLTRNPRTRKRRPLH